MAKLDIKINAKTGPATQKLNSLKGTIGGLQTAFAATGAVASVGALVGMVNSLTNSLDDIGKGAKRIGTTAEEFQKLSFAARRSGTDAGAVEAAFKRMSATIYDAANGSVEAKRALAALGLDTAAFEGRDTAEQFGIIADRLKQVEDHSVKAALAQKLFGRGGMDLLPMIDDYRTLADEAERLGLVIDNKTVAAAENFSDTMETLSTKMKAVIAETGFVEYLDEAAEGMLDLQQKSQNAFEFIIKTLAAAEDAKDLFGVKQGQGFFGTLEKMMEQRKLDQMQLAAQPEDIEKIKQPTLSSIGSAATMQGRVMTPVGSFAASGSYLTEKARGAVTFDPVVNKLDEIKQLLSEERVNSAQEIFLRQSNDIQSSYPSGVK